MNFSSSFLLSVYYRAIATASFVFRGRRGSAFLAKTLSYIKVAQHAFGLSDTGILIDGHLQRIFPDRSAEWRKKVIRGYWRNHQSARVALFNTSRMCPADLEEYLETDGREMLDEAVESGRGVLLLVPHFGDERTLHILLGMAGYPVSVISSAYAEYPPFVRRSRLKAGQRWNHVGFPGQNPRWMFDTLNRGEILHIAPTGYGGPKGTWVKNFGVPILASSTPWRLHRRTGCAMFTAYNLILPGMRYRLELEPFEPEPDGSDFTQRLFDRFEQKARQYPEQYEWLQLIIRHRESNTINRIGCIPQEERELEEQAIPADSDPMNIPPAISDRI